MLGAFADLRVSSAEILMVPPPKLEPIAHSGGSFSCLIHMVADLFTDERVETLSDFGVDHTTCVRVGKADLVNGLRAGSNLVEERAPSWMLFDQEVSHASGPWFKYRAGPSQLGYETPLCLNARRKRAGAR